MDSYRADISTLEAAEEAMLKVALDKAAATEARILPLMALLAVAVLASVALGLWLEQKTSRAELAAAETARLRRERDQSDLMARELNHRVKNLFAVVLSMITLSGRGETDVRQALAKLRDRVYALSVAHAVTQGDMANPVVSLHALLTTALRAYDPPRERISFSGPDVEIEIKSVTPLGLIVHELATNAIKYGALSQDGGRVGVAWSEVDGGDLALRWTESGGPATERPTNEGFGSVMMTAAAKQLGGQLRRDWRPEGVEVSLSMPLRPHIRQTGEG